MPVQVNDNGTLRLIHTIQVNDAGTLRNCYAVQINDGGTLRTAILPAISISNVTASGANGGTCAYSVQNDGDLLADGVSASTWVTPANAGAASFFEVRFSNKSGPDAAFLSGTFDTWLSTSTTRNVSLSAAPPNNGRTAGFDVEIRDAATQTVWDSASISLNTSTV